MSRATGLANGRVDAFRRPIGAAPIGNSRWWRPYLSFILLAVPALVMGGEVEPHAGHAMGTVNFPVSCSEPAQAEFNRAVLLLHHMTYSQAREAFEKVVATDPRCAMAHWGVAMTLFQPLWPTRPRPPALQRGWEETQKARSLEPPTERERLFVAAAEAFFLDPASPDFGGRPLRLERGPDAR